MPHDRKPSPWQPIETAPIDQDVLLYLPTDHYSHFRVGNQAGEKGNWITPYQDDFAVLDCIPTHWMPLSVAPEADNA